MATSDYIITPNDILRIFKRFGLRGFISLTAAIGIGVAVGWYFGLETAVFVGLFSFWALAGYSGRAFFGAAIALLIAIMAVSVYDTEYEVGDTNVVEKLAVWVFYFIAIGVLKLFIETIVERDSNKKQRFRPEPQPMKTMDRPIETPVQEKPKSATQHTRARAVSQNLATPMRQPKKQPINKKYIRPVHPAYTPTKQKRRIKPKGLIQG
jgi:hypothetical protein